MVGMENDINETMTHRIAELEAQLADVQREKDRLFGLLETALTTISRQALPAPASVSQTPSAASSRKTKDASDQEVVKPESQKSDWEKLKQWFFNA